MSIVDVKHMAVTNRRLFREFIKYCAVGAFAFLVDTGVLVVFTEVLFSEKSRSMIYLGVACGFVAGLVCNFYCAHLFVFTTQTQRARGNNIKGFALFGLIGLVGLVITEAGMLIGLTLVGHDGMKYVLVKCVVAFFVLIWNYVARKKIVYKGA